MKMMVLARDAETYASLLEGKLPEAVTLTVCSRVRMPNLWWASVR